MKLGNPPSKSRSASYIRHHNGVTLGSGLILEFLVALPFVSVHRLLCHGSARLSDFVGDQLPKYFVNIEVVARFSDTQIAFCR